MEPSELLRHVVDVFERLRVRYLVTGSIATIHYGEPRFTNDIVVDLPPERLADFCAAFPADDFYVDEASVRGAVAQWSQFNIIHPESGLKVDVMIPADTPFNHSRFSRAVRVKPESDYEASFASAEDVIIKKLEYFAAGGSDKHLRDITGVPKVSGDDIDCEYIGDWARRLALEAIWNAVRERWEGGPAHDPKTPLGASMDNRVSIVERILQSRVSAIVRTKEQRLAGDAMRAAVEGGFRLGEFTLTTPGALELIAEFAEKPELLVGAGTVLTVEQARAAVEAGARFLVSPVCDPQIIGEAHRLGVAAIPGTFTATEMETAHRAGADFVKLFPAPADLPAYIASILAPLPHLRIYPTNGVTVENVRDVLRAGAAGAGFATALLDPAWLADRDFAAIRRRAAEITQRAANT